MTMIHVGDCLEVMRSMDDNSVDAVVTDPPYGLAFMGKKWDYDVPSVEIWAECLRVLKPGGHLLAFAGTRTQHRMAVRIEDAGFEIRDMIAWVYGSGFPKSLDVSKAIDKAAGAEREVLSSYQRQGRSAGILGTPTEITRENTAPATEDARRWAGWGTALKPAMEPITVARKPLVGTVAANVLAWGTGAINVEGCRVGTSSTPRKDPHNGKLTNAHMEMRPWMKKRIASGEPLKGDFDGNQGRWPANLIHDGSAEVVEGFPLTDSPPPRESSGLRKRRSGFHMTDGSGGFGDSGSAARFFYCAKASGKERFTHLQCNCQTVKLCAWVRNQSVQHSASQSKDTCGEESEEGTSSNTSTFGKKQTDLFREDTRSTTLTKTSRTTDLKTCGSSPEQSISDCTEDARLLTACGTNRVVFAGECFQSLPNTFISHQKDGRFTGVVAGATSPLSSSVSVCEGCKSEVRKTSHPTQKPETLMRYLCRLVTPPGGVVLDPFMGSGSTGKAATLEGFQFVGIEREAEYAAIAQARIEAAGGLFV